MEQDELFDKYCEYQRYLLRREEWSNQENRQPGPQGNFLVCEPFVLAELHRLIPYVEDEQVKFHPINMPQLQIGKIEIVGFVVSVKEDSRYYEFTVEDGTGRAIIHYKKESYLKVVQCRRRIDHKYRMYAKHIKQNLHKFNQNCPKRFPKERPGFSYPKDATLDDIAILEQAWWEDVNRGLLGKKPERMDYIHTEGYCRLDFLVGRRPADEFTFNHLSMSRIYLLATKVSCIREKAYNNKLLSWLHNYIPKRYDCEAVHSNKLSS